MNLVMGMLLAAAAGEIAAAEPPTLEAKFAPLPRSERSYAGLGPAGPYYPAAAAGRRLNGEAVIECRAGKSGALKRCKVVSEKPGRHDFGAAAAVMATRGRIIAPSEPAPGEIVRLRVPFELGAPAEAAP